MLTETANQFFSAFLIDLADRAKKLGMDTDAQTIDDIMSWLRTNKGVGFGLIHELEEFQWKIPITIDGKEVYTSVASKAKMCKFYATDTALSFFDGIISMTRERTKEVNRKITYDRVQRKRLAKLRENDSVSLTTPEQIKSIISKVVKTVTNDSNDPFYESDEEVVVDGGWYMIDGTPCQWNQTAHAFFWEDEDGTKFFRPEQLPSNTIVKYLPYYYKGAK